MKKILFTLLFLPVISFCQDSSDDYNEIISEIKKTVKDDKKKNKVHRLEVGLNGGLNFAEITQDAINNDFNLDDKLGSLYGGTIVYNFNRFFEMRNNTLLNF